MISKTKNVSIISGMYIVKLLDVTQKAFKEGDKIKKVHFSIHISIYVNGKWKSEYVTEFQDFTNNCTYYKMAKKSMEFYPELERFRITEFIGETVQMRLTVTKKRNGDEFLHILYFKPLQNEDENKEENNNE